MSNHKCLSAAFERLAPGVFWCATCGAVGRRLDGRVQPWRLPRVHGAHEREGAALLRRAVGVVADVQRLSGEVAAVLDAYAGLGAPATRAPSSPSSPPAVRPALCLAVFPGGYSCDRPANHPGEHCDGDWAWDRGRELMHEEMAAGLRLGGPRPPFVAAARCPLSYATRSTGTPVPCELPEGHAGRCGLIP